jgi:N-methylhydantoinase A
LHAVELARALRAPRVIVPRSPGALSAEGALRADVVKNLSRTVMLEVALAAPDARLERAFREMEREARTALRREGFLDAKQRHERSIAARYRGQSFELEIEWDGGRNVVESFHRAHEARYGYAQAAPSIEVVSARLRSAGLVKTGPRENLDTSAGDGRIVRPPRRAAVYFEGGPRSIGVYARAELPAGARLQSPCVVTEYSSTTLVPPRARAALDRQGNLVIEA